MDSHKLMELGLTKREANAYITLLKLEEAKAGEIAPINAPLVSIISNAKFQIDSLTPEADIEKIIADNQKVVADYKAGKEASLQFLIGQGMKATKGSANPEMLKKLIVESI